MKTRALFPSFALLAVLLALQVLLPGAAAAQSGPPPPKVDPFCHIKPGTTIVEPTFPAVPPAGIPPVVGPGALAVIPAAGGGAVAPITTELGGCRGTVAVPADATRSLAVRIQGGISANTAPALPSAMTPPACRFTIDIFDAATGQRASTDPPSSADVALVPGTQPGTQMLAYYDAAKTAWQALPDSTLPSGTVVSAYIGQIHVCVLGTPEDPNVPKALPNTGGGPTTNWLIGIGIGAIGMVAIIGRSTLRKRGSAGSAHR